MKFQATQPLSNETINEINSYWHTNISSSDCENNEMIVVSNQEINAYKIAADELYKVFVGATKYAIDNKLLDKFGIPDCFAELIKESFEQDVHWHLYGKFVFAGGLDGMPIKLLEFNADSPNGIFEAGLIQWIIAQNANKQQFNNIYHALKDNFKRVVTLYDNTNLFDEKYNGWKMLFSCMRHNTQDENTTRFLQKVAHESGWITGFSYLDEMGFSPKDGIFDEDGVNYEFWYKQLPWLSIAQNEPNLANDLSSMAFNELAIFLNPAYTALFSSPNMLALASQLFPDCPYLQGAYNFPQDKAGAKYASEVFYIYGAAGLGFKKYAHENDSGKFVGHIIG